MREEARDTGEREDSTDRAGEELGESTDCREKAALELSTSDKIPIFT